MKFRKVITGAMAAFVVMLFAGSAIAAVATGHVNVRTGPGMQYRSINTLSPGQQVNIHSCQGSWCYVTYNGPAGWVSANYLAEGYTPPRFNQPRPPVHQPVWPPRPQPQQPAVNFSFGVPGFSFSIGNTYYRPYHQWYQGCIRRYGQIYCPVR